MSSWEASLNLPPGWSFVYFLPSNPQIASIEGARTGLIHLGCLSAECGVGDTGGLRGVSGDSKPRTCFRHVRGLLPCKLSPCRQHSTRHCILHVVISFSFLGCILKVISLGKSSVTTLGNRTRPPCYSLLLLSVLPFLVFTRCPEQGRAYSKCSRVSVKE